MSEESTPFAVVEGGAVFYIRADNINRPVFATNASGVKVWTASYLPFGGIATSTGTPITLRFPGQWFELESGLHQNWMRDYDPTTGRYLQADPLGLVDGASVFGYAGQSPLRWTDPDGMQQFSGGQSALIALAKGAGRTGITSFEADILLAWSIEYGIDCRDDRGTSHWVRGSHINIKNIHIPVR